MKDVLGKSLGDILLTANESTNWSSFVKELTSSEHLKYLMNRSINVYFEWGTDKICHLNGKTFDQLDEEFKNMPIELWMSGSAKKRKVESID